MSLREAEYLILDCEGQNLGREDGILSLVCVGTPHGEKVYVFDAVTLRTVTADMKTFLDLLSDESVIKIMWDGRMDYLEILLTFGIPLAGVLDLQIAEVVSRSTARGENDRDRLRRLQQGFFGFALVRSLSRHFDGLHLIMGMQKCLDMLGLGDQFQKDPVVQAMHSANQTHRWLERPLDPRLIAYAAQDIRLIGLLFDMFCVLGWILPAHVPGIVAQSSRYVPLFQTREASVAHDRRRAWVVLPLDILTEHRGTLYPCSVCLRVLSKSCFAIRKSGVGQLRHSFCRLCYIIAVRRGEPGVDVDEKWVPVW